MHPHATAVSRRNMLKTLGAGAAVLAFARGPLGAQPSSGGGAGTPQPFVLPKLPYAYDALEPHFDARTMEIHHTKHHQAYITAANKALASRPDLRELSGEELITRLSAFDEPLQTTLRNQLGGHLNHAFFWKSLAPAADYREGKLLAAIAGEFGSLEEFKKTFAQAAMTRFGSGWAWLVVKDGALVIVSTANQDSPLMNGEQPVIGLDVWEHAYYLNYQNRRADYVQAFWKVLNWDAAEAAYEAAL
jgi:Fe-Mn family superoxide dismutase